MKYSKFLLFLLLIVSFQLLANTYYVHPKSGSDDNKGRSRETAFRSLHKLNSLKFKAGDTIYLAAGFIHSGQLNLKNANGNKQAPLFIKSLDWNDGLNQNNFATIDFKEFENGILIENSSYIRIENLAVTSKEVHENKENFDMSCGVMIRSTMGTTVEGISIDRIRIFDIYNNREGFERGAEEVRTANGTQTYGWGIRAIVQDNTGEIKDLTIRSCEVTNVSHTGIKLTGGNHKISDVSIQKCIVKQTGGPGIQMSGVKDIEVTENFVSHSGSDDDSRKWGRGSGLWTWGSSNVLIEKNYFLYANGPGDSAGAHIDFNCDNIILQYNVSAYNSGGFCEILGNNYNCAYRFNLSVNDGHRVKGENGAFQEGKIFWLSGYQGKNSKRKGPVNTYFYNNTIYSDGSYTPKIAIEKSSKGILIANNIFAIAGKTEMVLGDQYNPEKENSTLASIVLFTNNLFLNKESWPNNIGFQPENPLYNNPKFVLPGAINPEAYIPQNIEVISGKGIEIKKLPGDEKGLSTGLEMKYDLLGSPITDMKFFGAIQPNKKRED